VPAAFHHTTCSSRSFCHQHLVTSSSSLPALSVSRVFITFPPNSPFNMRFNSLVVSAFLLAATSSTVSGFATVPSKGTLVVGLS
jgi:hypothetical protein